MKQKSFYLINVLVVIAVFMLIITACKKEDEPPVFNLAVSVTPQHSGTVAGAGNYQEGETASLSATPNEGFVFVNWTDKQGAEVSANASFSYTMRGNDVNITANFAEIEPDIYTLALEVDPVNSGTVDGAGEYEEGEAASLSAAPNEGFIFVNWTDKQDAEVSANASFQYTMPGEDITLKANFSEVKYSLTLEVNPTNAGSVEGAGDYLAGQTVSLSATPNEGFVFVNWTDKQDAEVSANASFQYTMPGEEVTLKAIFSEVRYTLTLQVNPSDAGTVDGAGNYEEGKTASLSATPNEGFVFVNWTDEQNAEVSTDASLQYTMPGEDLTLTANFSEVKYTLTLQVNPPDAGTVDGAGDYGAGETVSLSASANADFGFVYWTDQNNKRVSTDASFNYLMPSEDITLTANFIIEEITPGGGVTDFNGNKYKTVLVGDQHWMAENLRVENFNNGTPIPAVLDDTDWQNDNSGAYALYPHDDVEGIGSPSEMAETYGYLYNWHAVVHASGLCPAGWRVSTHNDWLALVSYLENTYGMHNELEKDPLKGAGNALKSRRQWGSPFGGEYDTQEHPRWYWHHTEFGFDMFGFSALPGGVRHHDGRFMSLGPHGYWWSSIEYDENNARGRYLNADRGNVNGTINDKNSGYSVRCIKVD